MNQRIAVLLLALLLFAIPTSSQTQPQLTSAEDTEAKRIAHAFYDDLLTTKDVRPLVSRYFVADYVRRNLLNTGAHYGTHGMTSLTLWQDVAKKIGRRNVERYLIAETNFLFLNDLIESSDPQENHSRKERLPKDITNIMRGEPFFESYLAASDEGNARDDDDMKEMASSIPRFWRMLHVFKRVNPLLASYATKVHAGETDAWKQSVKDLGKRFGYFEPFLTPCRDECFGFGKDKRIIIVNIPVLQLAMTNVNGQMKILRAVYFVD